MKKIAVLTSGGDSPGMNAAIRAVVRCGIEKGMDVYGVDRGYEGLMNNELHLMERRDVGGILHRGGTILGTARSPEFMTEEGQLKAVKNLEARGIEGIVVIGGNGTLAGGKDLAKRGIKVMGVPGTIDNDLDYTDYTIGFDTAVNTVLEAISRLRDTSSAHDRTTVVEVMGRDCGDIALYAGLAGGAEYVLLPGEEEDIAQICRKVIEGADKGKKHSIIIKAEGSKVPNDELVAKLDEATGKETKLVVLSYLQRGGSPSAMDRILATMTGAKAVELLAEGSESMAVGIRKNQIAAYPLAEALEMEAEHDDTLLKLVDILSK